MPFMICGLYSLKDNLIERIIKSVQHSLTRFHQQLKDHYIE